MYSHETRGILDNGNKERRVKRILATGTALVALSFGAVSCVDSGPGLSKHCVDWDHDKVKRTVSPKPGKVHAKVWDRSKHKYVDKWVDGPTPKPYVTSYMKVECEEWVTESPTPTNS